MNTFQWYLSGAAIAFLIFKIMQHKIENMPKEKKARMPQNVNMPKGDGIFIFLSLFSWFMVGLQVFSFLFGLVKAHVKNKV